MSKQVTGTADTTEGRDGGEGGIWANAVLIVECLVGVILVVCTILLSNFMWSTGAVQKLNLLG